VAEPWKGQHAWITPDNEGGLFYSNDPDDYDTGFDMISKEFLEDYRAYLRRDSELADLNEAELIVKLMGIIEELHIGDGDEPVWEDHDAAWQRYRDMEQTLQPYMEFEATIDDI
jgi:hypothetical protein